MAALEYLAIELVANHRPGVHGPYLCPLYWKKFTSSPFIQSNSPPKKESIKHDTDIA